MKRRQLIRNVASASMVTMVGASAAAAAERGVGEEPYLAVRQDDGSHEVIERETADVEPDCEPECYYWLCCECDCDCCSCTQFCPA